MKRKEAIEVIKKNWPDSSFMMLRDALETLIPELKESEDERIKNELVDFIYDKTDTYELREKSNSWLAWLEKQVEQKPIEWSEEDKKHFDNIIQELKNQCDRPINASYKEIIVSDIDWFKSLKDRVQSKQGWSEEDNRICKAIIDNIKDICKEGYFVGNISSDKLINWLKSLRFQKQWKPSKKQLHYLSWILNIKLGDNAVEQEVSKHLNELYKQLKQF